MGIKNIAAWAKAHGMTTKQAEVVILQGRLMMTGIELAAWLHVDRSTVSNWRQGNARPPESVLIAMRQRAQMEGVYDDI